MKKLPRAPFRQAPPQHLSNAQRVEREYFFPPFFQAPRRTGTYVTQLSPHSRQRCFRLGVVDYRVGVAQPAVDVGPRLLGQMLGHFITEPGTCSSSHCWSEVLLV